MLRYRKVTWIICSWRCSDQWAEFWHMWLKESSSPCSFCNKFRFSIPSINYSSLALTLRVWRSWAEYGLCESRKVLLATVTLTSILFSMSSIRYNSLALRASMRILSQNLVSCEWRKVLFSLVTAAGLRFSIHQSVVLLELQGNFWLVWMKEILLSVDTVISIWFSISLISCNSLSLRDSRRIGGCISGPMWMKEAFFSL